MIIKSYECTRFAGLKNKKLEFSQGLNVILGENESGKSTIIEGIQSVLFKGIRLRKNNNVDLDFSYRFMPKPKGDFIDGKLVLETINGPYEISKEWGSSESIELLTPKGSLIRNEKEVEEELATLLNYGESTYSNIVFAKQRELKAALSNIIGNSDVTKEVSDLLRMALMELDGISISEIEDNLESQIEELYRKWDREKNYPQNNRGVNDPYKTGLGLILKSFYHKENIKKQMEEASKIEKEFERLGREINDLRDTRDILGKERFNLERIESDINDRLVLNAEIEALKKELGDLVLANREWPSTEQALEQLDKRLSELEIEEKKLEIDKGNLERIARRESIGRRLKEINRIQEELGLLNKELSSIANLRDSDIERLEKLNKEILTLDIAMESGKIKALVKKSDKEVFLTNQLGEVKSLSSNVAMEVKGYMSISYGDEFQLEIRSTKLDLEDINKRYMKLKDEETGLLKSLGIANMEEGKVNLKEINNINAKIASLKREIDFILDEDTIEQLRKDFKELDEIQVFKDLDTIKEEIASLNHEEIELITDKKIKSNQLDLWTEKYINHDNLLDLLIDARTKLRLKEEALKTLSPLPEEFETIDGFKLRLKYLKEELANIENTLELLNIDYYETKNNLSDETYEELRKQYLDSTKSYDRNIHRGQKLLEIHKVFSDTKARLASNPMETLVSEFSRLLELITGGDYKTGDIDEEFNIVLENSNGSIPIELLSAGTYDSVSLALRFSLLRHLFKDLTGYVILDDCLVDLDPKRRKQAINLIKDFSKDYQIIFTTCNPETAELLGGRIIEV